MKKNPELASRLRDVYCYLEGNTHVTTRQQAMKILDEVINELDPPTFPEPIDSIEIRDITYFPGYEPKTKQRRFDIVKWENHPPREVTNLRTGKKEISTCNCYSIATLEWDEKERGFELHSVGTRWLEAAPSKKVCDMILKFCDKMAAEYEEEDRYED